jgi:hypothetical protein
VSSHGESTYKAHNETHGARRGQRWQMTADSLAHSGQVVAAASPVPRQRTARPAPSPNAAKQAAGPSPDQNTTEPDQASQR